MAADPVKKVESLDLNKNATENSTSTKKKKKNQNNQNAQNAGINISQDQWLVLGPVWKVEGIAQKDIAEYCGKDKTSVTKIIDTLEKRNLMVRVPNQLDQRIKRVFLSNKGKELMESTMPIMEQTRNEVREGIKKLTKLGMENLIFDLQGNPGGLLYSAKYLSDEFLSGEKLVVYSEGRAQPRQDLKTEYKGLWENGRLVVLTNEYSASASAWSLACGVGPAS